MRILYLSSAAILAVASVANAATIIDNTRVQLGVDDFGQLNVRGSSSMLSPIEGTREVGLRFLPTGNEGTAHGCLCEGYGVGIADAFGARVDSGSANNGVGGVVGLDLISFNATDETATSIVALSSGALRITHSFAPSSPTLDLYQVNVSIENTSGAVIEDLRYTRTFDWDVEPTAFDELVTVQGVDTTPTLLSAIDNGFVSSDPFATDRTPILVGGTGDFMDHGPDDLGVNFDFGFGALAVDEALSFRIFFGASATEAEALTALSDVGAELYSLGQSSDDPDGLGVDSVGGGPTNTFVFAFGGVGGRAIVLDPDMGGGDPTDPSGGGGGGMDPDPDPGGGGTDPDPDPGGGPGGGVSVVPTPASLWLFLAALATLHLLRRRGSGATPEAAPEAVRGHDRRSGAATG